MTNCADLENELALFKAAEIAARNDLIKKIYELPTHEYKEYDGHDEVVIRECVYLSDLMNLLNPIYPFNE